MSLILESMTGCFAHYLLRVFIEPASHSTFTEHGAFRLSHKVTYNVASF